jgi:hypothetical protein
MSQTKICSIFNQAAAEIKKLKIITKSEFND